MYTRTILLIVFISMFLTGCASIYSAFNYSKKDKVTQFQISKEIKYKYKVEDARYKIKPERCVDDAFTLEVKALKSDLMIEHIGLNFDCSWYGLPRSMYTGFIKDKINAQRMELIQRIEINEYEFSIFKTDKHCIIYLLSISQNKNTTFIVDKTGDFFNDLLLKLNPNHEVMKLKQTCSVDFNSSLMDTTGLQNNYFGRESVTTRRR